MIIRLENPHDYPGIRAVNEGAFKTPAEAHLVDMLRDTADPILSLVAEEQGEIVGHIMFSPVTLSAHNELKIMGLGPLAVIPAQQEKGIGTALVQKGLEECRQLGYGAVIVLGHPWFYPRFGFFPAARYHIRCEYDVPEDVFMLIELTPGYLEDAAGIIKYHPAFNEVS